MSYRQYYKRIDVRCEQQFFIESGNIFKQVLTRKDFKRVLVTHVVEKQLYNVHTMLWDVFICHLKAMIYSQVWKFFDFLNQLRDLILLRGG